MKIVDWYIIQNQTERQMFQGFVRYKGYADYTGFDIWMMEHNFTPELKKAYTAYKKLIHDKGGN